MEHDLDEEDLIPNDNRHLTDNLKQWLDLIDNQPNIDHNQDRIELNLPEMQMNSNNDLRLGSNFKLRITSY